MEFGLRRGEVESICRYSVVGSCPHTFRTAEVSRETPGSPQPTYRYRVLRPKKGDMSQSSARLSHLFGLPGVRLPRRRFSYAHTGSKVASLPEGEALAG